MFLHMRVSMVSCHGSASMAIASHFAWNPHHTARDRFMGLTPCPDPLAHQVTLLQGTND